MEHYSIIKRNEVLVHATTLNLEDMLSEISQSQKITYYTIPFIENVQTRQIHGDKIRIVIAYG